MVTVSENDLAILKAARETAEQAEVQGFDQATSAASGPNAAYDAPLENGKIKNKVLKLYLYDLVHQIEQAQGQPVNQSEVTDTKSQLTQAIALDQSKTGQPCRGVPFSSETQPAYAAGSGGWSPPGITNSVSYVAYVPPAGYVAGSVNQSPIPVTQPDSDHSSPFPNPATNTAPGDFTPLSNTKPYPLVNSPGANPPSTIPQEDGSDTVVPLGGDADSFVAPGSGGTVPPGVDLHSDTGDACISPSTNTVPPGSGTGSTIPKGGGTGKVVPLGGDSPPGNGDACAASSADVVPPEDENLQPVPGSKPVSAPFQDNHPRDLDVAPDTLSPRDMPHPASREPGSDPVLARINARLVSPVPRTWGVHPIGGPPLPLSGLPAPPPPLVGHPDPFHLGGHPDPLRLGSPHIPFPLDDPPPPAHEESPPVPFGGHPPPVPVPVPKGSPHVPFGDNSQPVPVSFGASPEPVPAPFSGAPQPVAVPFGDKPKPVPVPVPVSVPVVGNPRPAPEGPKPPTPFGPPHTVDPAPEGGSGGGFGSGSGSGSGGRGSGRSGVYGGSFGGVSADGRAYGGLYSGVDEPDKGGDGGGMPPVPA